MVKVKNLEKKDKSTAEFDKKNPGSRVKSINEGKLKKKQPQKKSAVLGGTVEKEVKPLVKEAKKEIAKALKAKENLTKVKESETPKEEGAVVELPEHLATKKTIKDAVKALKQGVDKEKEDATNKNLFDDELRFGLQVVAVKIPKTPPHTKKIILQNSLFGDDQPDICFIIRDQKPKKADLIVDETILKFEEKLKESGITGVKTILPLSKLKKDFGPNNMKRKLLNTYDLFFVESEIAEHTYTILGKHFIHKRKRPIQIDTKKVETMKISFENGIRKVSFKVSPSSNSSVFEIGTVKMETTPIVENIFDAIEQLKEKWPGGWKNVLRLYLKPMKQSKVSIPLYYSKVNPNDVEVPVEVGVKQTRLDKLNELLAKKSKKLRLDRKTKKIVKVKGQAPVAKKDKKKTDKKRKSDDGEVQDAKKVKKEEKTSEAEPAVEETKAKKKKKKNSESETVAEDKKAKKEVPETVDNDQKVKKKKKKNSESEIVAETKVEVEQEATEKKKKKKKNVEPEVEPAVVEKAPKKDKKKKNKN